MVENYFYSNSYVDMAAHDVSPEGNVFNEGVFNEGVFNYNKPFKGMVFFCGQSTYIKFIVVKLTVRKQGLHI